MPRNMNGVWLGVGAGLGAGLAVMSLRFVADGGALWTEETIAVVGGAAGTAVGFLAGRRIGRALDPGAFDRLRNWGVAGLLSGLVFVATMTAMCHTYRIPDINRVPALEALLWMMLLGAWTGAVLGFGRGRRLAGHLHQVRATPEKTSRETTDNRQEPQE